MRRRHKKYGAKKTGKVKIASSSSKEIPRSNKLIDVAVIVREDTVVRTTITQRTVCRSSRYSESHLVASASGKGICCTARFGAAVWTSRVRDVGHKWFSVRYQTTVAAPDTNWGAGQVSVPEVLLLLDECFRYKVVLFTLLHTILRCFIDVSVAEFMKYL